MVVISSPACITASVRQLLMRCPLTITVQAPHCPWSQPFFVPVNPRCSRNASSSVTRGSRSRAWRRPLTVSATVSLCIGAASAAASADAGREAMAKVAAPAVPRKRRRDNRERNGSILSTAVPTIECYMQDYVVHLLDATCLLLLRLDRYCLNDDEFPTSETPILTGLGP